MCTNYVLLLCWSVGLLGIMLVYHYSLLIILGCVVHFCVLIKFTNNHSKKKKMVLNNIFHLYKIGQVNYELKHVLCVKNSLLTN